jgi:hypothetical protein
MRKGPSSPLILDSGSKGTPLDAHGRPTHPVFAVATTTSHSSLLEMDYNLHKSNSTYYADMDISRTPVIARLYGAGREAVSKEFDAEIAARSVAEGKKPSKKKLPIFIALGGVYCSFKKEIKPYETFDMRSQLVAWDEKWLYIVTYFLKADKPKGTPVVAAVGVSKYCVKKGRWTVPPERFLRVGGYLPPRPEGMTPAPGLKETSTAGTPASGSEGVTSVIDGTKLAREVSKLSADVLDRQRKDKNAAASWDADEWTWERIEELRKRGLETIQGFLTLDSKLYDDW